MDDNVMTIGCAIGTITLAILFVVSAWVFRSAMEAQAYNHVTGNNVSTWDAMFIELRVQDSPNQRD